jgi:hypothetical protein
MPIFFKSASVNADLDPPADPDVESPVVAHPEKANIATKTNTQTKFFTVSPPIA